MFRHLYKNIICPDAWSYCAARALKTRFLTGDPVFKGLENVEFVR